MYSIKRKPVGQNAPTNQELEKTSAESGTLGKHNGGTETYEHSATISRDVEIDDEANLESPVKEEALRPDFDEQLDHLHLETEGGGPPADLTDAIIPEDSDTVSGAQAQDTNISKFKTAYSEVKYFSGGLMTRPFEATKNYSLLRHSHGLVFYKGPTTNIAITVFSDRQLPAKRSLWLQKKGISGKTGMKLEAKCGKRNTWIDVTPSTDASADMLPNDDERAWQRDITKFLKKAKQTKNLCNHRPCETNVVRIPHVAEDGYFRIVLCVDGKVLCPSPVFRYASASLNPGNLRGASLRMLPLEVGIKIGCVVARHAANTAAAGAIQPVVSTVQAYRPNSVAQWAATGAYSASGAADKVDDTVKLVNQQYTKKKELDFEAATGEAVEGAEIVGSDEGPESPYPIRFSGRLKQEFDMDNRQRGLAGLCLADVPEETLLRLSGAYMGWFSIPEASNPEIQPMKGDVRDTWYEAVILVLPERGKQTAVVPRRQVSVFPCQNLGAAFSLGAEMNVIIMGFFHNHEWLLFEAGSDVELRQERMLGLLATARLSLSRPAWSAEVSLLRVPIESSTRSLTERISDARLAGQKRMDKIPIHKLGVRTASMGLKDRLIGSGGLCIKR